MLNDLHEHLGTPGQGRKLDAVRSLNKLGVATSNLGYGVTLGREVGLSGAASLFPGGIVEFPDAMNAAVAYEVVIPDDATKLIGVEVAFYNATPNSNLRLTTTANLLQLGGPSVGISFGPVANTVAVGPDAVWKKLFLPSSLLFGEQELTVKPGSVFGLFFERNGGNAADTFNANLYVMYFKLIVK